MLFGKEITTCASMTIKPTCRIKVDFPPIFGPVTSNMLALADCSMVVQLSYKNGLLIERPTFKESGCD